MKIIFLQPYPIEGPSSRYRVEQYIPYLRAKGINCLVRPFASSAFYRVLYKKGFYARKIILFLLSSLNRFLDLFRVLGHDIVFIHLEAFPLGLPIFEWFVAKIFNKKIIYDLDDAIYMGSSSCVNPFFRFLKCSSKIKTILKLSRQVVTCNKYLYDYATKFNKNVIIVHTPVDTDKFTPKFDRENDCVVIGWIGSHSTQRYLQSLRDVFISLSRKYRFKLKVIGAGKILNLPGVEIINLDWSLKDEISQFQSLDIGVYPLPDNEWTLGKTGFKTIQYMSVGIPCVASNVGANKDIIKNGVNGYLVDSQDEWVNALSLLIKDKDLRLKVGCEGRKTVLERFSLKVNAPKILEIIERTAAS